LAGSVLKLQTVRKGMSVAANLARIKETLGMAPVTLIAVTKTVGIASIEEAYASGVTEFAENRVQDALEKQQQVPPQMADKIHWHLIGHLQTNKVKKVIGKFDLIHSVDSWHLAQEISAQAQSRSTVQPVLLQVKVVEDPSKFGFQPDELRARFRELLALPGLRIDGFMTMAPLTDDRNVWRASFNGLHALRDELASQYGIALKELSMGMTQDWQEAVQCGATMIRLGRAVFGTGSEVPQRGS
jgi:PLP dependent protein